MTWHLNFSLLFCPALALFVNNGSSYCSVFGFDLREVVTLRQAESQL